MDSSLSAITYMKCGEATLPERLQIQSTAVDPYLFVEIATHNIETLTLRLTSSVAFTLIMRASQHQTVVVVVLLEKVTLLRSQMSLTLMTVTGMYVWRGNGKRYVKQCRTIASIDDHTDGNNRPNKRNRTIDILMMRIVMTTMIVTTIIVVMVMLILTTIIVTTMIHTIIMMMML